MSGKEDVNEGSYHSELEVEKGGRRKKGSKQCPPSRLAHSTTFIGISSDGGLRANLRILRWSSTGRRWKPEGTERSWRERAGGGGGGKETDVEELDGSRAVWEEGRGRDWDEL